MKAEEHSIQDILSPLSAQDKEYVQKLHEYALALGCTPKIAAMGKKPNDWKCEYIIKKKNILLILRVSEAQWSVRCKLFHIADYPDVLEQCNDHCIARLLANAKDCGNHGGACAGPVSFTLRGTSYSKCRHYLLFDQISGEDLESIQKLLASEAGFGQITVNK